MARFIRFDGENGAIVVNNADWLLNLNYVDFLRDIGVYFSVNKMLTAECYRSRMEKGLTFLEFNYMLMQAYDSSCSIGSSGVCCSWAGTTSGATFSREPISSAARSTRRRLP